MVLETTPPLLVIGTRLKQNKAIKKLIVIGLVLLCLLQYPFLALITPDKSLGHVPYSLISILLVWIAFIFILNLVLNRNSISERAKEND